jgi:hypothetical protein
MDKVDLIINSSIKFYNDLKLDKNGRFHSWEHCYFHFYNARGNENADEDYLSLQLAFYLASWGMYRGSSFLLQKDYRVHLPVVKEILKDKYDPLMGINCSELKKESNQKLLIEINHFISEYYDNIRKKIKGQDLKHDLSYTLITKILMGTLGCVPAYDRYFISGIRNQQVAVGNYNMKSILQLVDFYEHNKDKLEMIRNTMKVYNLPYPQMKILDMGFWQIGYDLDKRK